MSDVCERLAGTCQMLVEKSQFGTLNGTWLKAQVFWCAKNPAGYRRGSHNRLSQSWRPKDYAAVSNEKRVAVAG